MYVRIYVCGMVIAAAEDIQSEASKYNYSTSTLGALPLFLRLIPSITDSYTSNSHIHKL